MTSTESSLADSPLSALKLTDRIQSLDIMRGIVLLGILLMNINAMGLYGAYDNPTVSGGATGWNLTTWIVTNMFFEGTMRALFSLLFGVGMFVLLDRLEKKGAGINAANIYFRRLCWLLVFGLINGYLLLWEGEVLYDYALMGFLVFSFRNLAPKNLILIALLLFALGTLWSYNDYRNDAKLAEEIALAKKYTAEKKPLTKELQAALETSKKKDEAKSPKTIAEHNKNMQKDYLSVMLFLAPTNMRLNEIFPYRFDVWDVLSMMLLGIALYKLRILSAEKSYSFYGLMALIGYAIGLAVNYYETRLLLDNNFSFIASSQAYLTYDLGRVPVAIGHISLIMIFCKLPILKRLKASLAAVGKMALTNYIMHSIIAMFVFTGAGFGLFGKLQRFELLYVVFSIWVFQLIASPIWLRYFHFGPIEWVWRNLSYLKRHEFRK